MRTTSSSGSWVRRLDRLLSFLKRLLQWVNLYTIWLSRQCHRRKLVGNLCKDNISVGPILNAPFYRRNKQMKDCRANWSNCSNMQRKCTQTPCFIKTLAWPTPILRHSMLIMLMISYNANAAAEIRLTLGYFFQMHSQSWASVVHPGRPGVKRERRGDEEPARGHPGAEGQHMPAYQPQKDIQCYIVSHVTFFPICVF